MYDIIVIGVIVLVAVLRAVKHFKGSTTVRDKKVLEAGALGGAFYVEQDIHRKPASI